MRVQSKGNARITYIWVTLCVLAVVSALVARMSIGDDPTPSAALGLAVLAIGAVKSRLILTEFMEIRTAPLWLRLSTDVWLFGTFAAIIVL
jgi:hypothetical protein